MADLLSMQYRIQELIDQTNKTAAGLAKLQADLDGMIGIKKPVKAKQAKKTPDTLTAKGQMYAEASPLPQKRGRKKKEVAPAQVQSQPNGQMSYPSQPEPQGQTP